MEKFVDTWSELRKQTKQATATQVIKETTLLVNRDKLFDIAHVDVVTLVRIPEDQLCLKTRVLIGSFI